MKTTKKEQLTAKLIELYKNKLDVSGSDIGSDGFSASYIHDNSFETALSDIDYVLKLSENNPLEICLYRSPDKSPSSVHLRLFQWQTPLALSDILPMLENFGLRTSNEYSYQICPENQQLVSISDFHLLYSGESCDIDKIHGLFQESFSMVHQGLAESDSFNKLVLGASLSWREVTILRAYAKYLQQTGFRFSQPYIEKALSENAAIVQDLVSLFKIRHDPFRNSESTADSESIENELKIKLESVTSLDEDRILNRMIDLIKATLRTNYFQCQPDGTPKAYLAFKFDSAAIPELPLPRPMFEIFVYSTTFEGIHLRKNRIARGGIRWSDRREDFRTEVLGLMKAQVVKNTVIVPTGAKGGFVVKTIPPSANRDTIQGLVIQSYKSFISALLDVTDNIKNGHNVAPQRVVCHDEIDPYLVVAADKGTATFSDIANGLANDYDFWLGDAFASGGSAGYDHKKIGITARGTWESVKRHFRELNCDVQKTDISVIAVGDMSGDVMGNGMLYTRHLKLLAAFDHRHIFIDPDPDPEISFCERERLFKLPSSSWENYNTKLISKGGGVFSRTLKSISLTPEMKQVFAVNADRLTPNELISVMLKAPVDLLFNGGIGTYVKSSRESHADAGDKTNDYCRVNANELRCKVVGEGGNLGLTQRARVEFALKGGLVYTDFIDNSAGVDCSDHEVNLKILLDNEVSKGLLTEQQRNELLASLTEEVASLVLSDNQAQALVISFSAHSAQETIALHTAYIKELESSGLLDRHVEFLPDEKELVERKAAGLGLTRPELAILLAYTKIYLKQEIQKSPLPEDPWLSRIVVTAFPPLMGKTYATAMQQHRLKRDIVSTQLANLVVNQMGMIFVYQMQTETGASVEDIIRAYVIASESFETQALQATVVALDFRISMAEQFDILANIRKLIKLATRWFLHRNYHRKDLQKTIAHYNRSIKLIQGLIPELMSGSTKEYMESLISQFSKAGISTDIAVQIATYRAIYTSLNVIEVATSYNIDLQKTARIYFSGGQRMNLVWFRDEIANDTRVGYWHSLTRLTLRDELDILQQAITIAIIKVDDGETDFNQLIDKWLAMNQPIVERWEKFMALLHASGVVEYTMFFIAIRELSGLIQHGQNDNSLLTRRDTR